MRTRPRSWLAPALPFPFSPALLGLVALLAVPVACGGGSGGAGGSGATGAGGASSSSSSGAAGHGGNGGGMGGSGGIGGSGGGTVFDPASCAPEEIHCVDDDPGPSAEYPTIQAAVDACSPGDTVLVFAGGYPGFRVSKSGTAQAPISVRAEAGVVFTGPEALTHNVIRIQAASHVHIEGFRIQGSGLPNPYDYDHACLAARGATADAPMEGIVLRGNDISGCSPSGMYLSQTRGLVLEDNVIHDNVLEAENGNGNGVYLANAGTDEVIVRGNRFTGNAGNGIHFNGDASVGGDGVQTGHLFERNVIADNGVNGFNMDGVQGSTFVNNLFANNGRHGVRGFAIDAAEGPKDDVFINNTFVGNAGAGVKMSEDAGGHVLFNDLFIGNAEGGIVIEETTPLTSNNLDQAPSAGVFADAAAKDYHLAAGSPAIDAGIASFAGEAAPADDLSGAARSGAPDLGCYER